MKDPSQLSSYHIIRLQNVYSKLIEEIVVRKIYLEAKEILTDYLGIYRLRLMTWGNTGTFSYDVYGFQCKMETVVVTLDKDFRYGFCSSSSQS